METLQGFRLSPPQRHLWSSWQRRGGVPRTGCALLIEGALDEARLEAAIARTVARHEVLRTHFRCLPGMAIPIQRIGEEVGSARVEAVVGPVDGADPRSLARSHLAALLARSCDLERGAPLEWALVAIGGERHLLLLSLPALNADAPSLCSLVAELAGVAGEGEPLQYADLSEWQNELLESEDAAEEREVWARRDPPSSPPALPGARAAGVAGPELRRLEARLPAAASRCLEGLVGEAPPGAFFLLGWASLLARLLESARPPAVAVTFECRHHDLLVGAVGPLSRSIPLELELGPGASVAQALRSVADEMATLAAWQEYFDPSTTGPGGEGALLYGFGFLTGTEPRSADGLTWSLLELEPPAAGYLAEVLCRAAEDGFSLVLRYDAARLDAPAAERLLERYRCWLERAGEAPERALAEIDLLTEAERRQLWVELNDTAAPFELEATLYDLVRERLEEAPDAVAVVAGGEALSARALLERGHRLAARLRAAGVGPEVPVAICAERSLDLVAGLLAVLEAGGAFVPLDPSFPQRRLLWMLEDSRAPLVLVDERSARLLGETPAATLRLDTASPAGGLDDTDREDTRAAPCAAGLAYVIYTSGSTGRPKGVMVSHRAVRNHLLWVTSTYPLGAGDGALQKTPLSFDVAIREIFWPLAVGARLELARPGGQADPAYLLEVACERRIRVLNFVPALLAAFLDQPGVERCGAERVLSGGEALDGALCERFFSTLGARLHNHYGPTETTVTATRHTCRRGGSTAGVPLGRPLANTRIYLLDRRLRPAVPGLPGELCIGGAGLARGYLGRAGLSAERFVPDAESGLEGERLYKSGDLARFGPGAELEYLGRFDDQVKLRGLRIELGEVEAAARSHPAVREAVVVAREGAGGKRLLAYVVPERGAAPSERELRAHLEARLPAHMLPAAWRVLDRLPLTPTGKVDRRALPDPEVAAEDTEAVLTPTEEILKAIWEELLEHPGVGLRESFFDLGGHSLLATRVVARVRQLLRVDLPLRAFFEAPTIAGLAAHVDTLAAAGEELEAAIEPSPPGAEPEISWAQQRLWLVEQLEPGSWGFNIPLTLRVRGALDVRALAGTFARIIGRHETLRSSFQTSAGQPRLEIHDRLGVPLPRLDLEALSEADREREGRRIAVAESRRPIRLDRVPLLRMALVRLAGTDHLLVMTLHHVVSDAWSASVMLREFGEIYPALVEGRAPRLPELPIQYRDFARWQQRWLSGARLERQLAYWRAQLGDAPPPLELPGDRPRPERSNRLGPTRPVAMPPELAESLRRLARAEGCTLFMVLMAGFQLLLHHLTGRDDVVVGTDIANRHRVELESLIGFFINQLAIRTDFSGDPSFRQVLERVRGVTLDAYAHQDLPFDRLIESLRPERSLGRQPIFQVKFFLQNVPRQAASLPGLEIAPVVTDHGISTIDLTLALAESRDGLKGWVNYRSELFDDETVAGWLEDLGWLLGEAAARPDSRVEELCRGLDARAAARRLERGRQVSTGNVGKFKRRRGRRPGSTPEPEGEPETRLATAAAGWSSTRRESEHGS